MLKQATRLLLLIGSKVLPRFHPIQNPTLLLGWQSAEALQPFPQVGNGDRAQFLPQRRWAVFAGGKTKRGALAGSYGGASAEATVGVGLGANVLVGGFKKSIALQPLSIQGQEGLNIAAGIAGLSLNYAGQ